MTGKKTDFTTEYNRPDPRAYYATLGELDYQIPSYGAPVFRHLSGVLGAAGEPPTLLDVCCSYGINAALLNHDVTFAEIRDHYAAPGVDRMSREELIETDRHFLTERRRPDPVRMIGLDISDNAVAYAVDVGLLADGIVADLEAEDAVPAAVTDRLAEADLVTVTGGVGYVNERTFETILDASDDPPWIAALTLRWIGFDPIAGALKEHGLVTERLDGYVVPQRRFADRQERQLVFNSLDEHGLEPTALEEAGWHCAELFIARPEEAVQEQSVDELFDGVL